jgi:hypothetical protein
MLPDPASAHNKFKLDRETGKTRSGLVDKNMGPDKGDR